MDIEKNPSAGSFEEYFSSALLKASQTCDIALTDILAARMSDGKVDTKTLKDITASLKDLNGLGGDRGREPLCVVFSSEAERYSG